VARPAILRAAISRYEAWIEEQLGVPISECVIVESPHNVSQLGIEKILALNHREFSAGLRSRLNGLLFGRAGPAAFGCEPLVD